MVAQAMAQGGRRQIRNFSVAIVVKGPVGLAALNTDFVAE